jgi:hypothetical protein
MIFIDMKTQLQFQQAMQHMLNVAKTQPTVVKSTPPAPELVTKVPAEPIVEVKPVEEKPIEQPKVEQPKTRLPHINK